MIAATICFSWAFLTAYFNPAKEVTILIDSYGEANFEIWLMAFSIPFILYTILKLLRNYDLIIEGVLK